MAGRNPRGHPGPLLRCKISSASVTPGWQMFNSLHLKTFSSGDTAVSPQKMCPSASFYFHQKMFPNACLGCFVLQPTPVAAHPVCEGKEKRWIPFSLPISHAFDDSLVSELCQSHHTAILTRCSGSTSRTASALLSDNLCSVCILEVRCTIYPQPQDNSTLFPQPLPYNRETFLASQNLLWEKLQ